MTNRIERLSTKMILPTNPKLISLKDRAEEFKDYVN